MEPFITYLRFNRLSNNDKYILLEDHGTYLGVSYLQGSYQVALFELNGFYVEVWLNRPEDSLLKATAFVSYKKLDQFIKEIDLTPVYALL